MFYALRYTFWVLTHIFQSVLFAMIQRADFVHMQMRLAHVR